MNSSITTLVHNNSRGSGVLSLVPQSTQKNVWETREKFAKKLLVDLVVENAKYAKRSNSGGEKWMANVADGIPPNVSRI